MPKTISMVPKTLIYWNNFCKWTKAYAFYQDSEQSRWQREYEKFALLEYFHYLWALDDFQ